MCSCVAIVGLCLLERRVFLGRPEVKAGLVVFVSWTFDFAPDRPVLVVERSLFDLLSLLVDYHIGAA